MVTPQGFNALLKIVEEPPEHVKFVFATTEPEKVIGTIRSRTHHYPFRLVPPKKLTDYMERLLGSEQVPFEPGVLSFVTRAGGGSVRDSLSVLDQLIAGSGGEGLTYAGASSLLGFTDDELLDGIIEAFAARDSAAVFRQIDKVVESGSDPRRFVEDLLERLRDLIVVAAVGEGVGAVLRSLPEDQLARMRQQAASFGSGALSHAADVINAGLTEMTGATSPRLQLELMCARVLLPGIAGLDGYAARLDRMERRLDMGELPTGRGVGQVPHAPLMPPSEASAPRGDSPRREPANTPASQPQPQPVQPAARESASDTRQPAAPQRQEASAPQRQDGQQPQEGQQREETPERQQQTERQPQGERIVSSAQAERASQPAQSAQVDQSSQAAQSQSRGGLSTDDIRRAWPDVLDRIFRIKRVTWTLLSQNAQVMHFDGERLVLGASSGGLASTMSRGQHPEVVRQALIEAIGVDVRVEARPMDDPIVQQGSAQQQPRTASEPQPGQSSPVPQQAQSSRGPQQSPGTAPSRSEHDIPDPEEPYADAPPEESSYSSRGSAPSAHAAQGNGRGQDRDSSHAPGTTMPNGNGNGGQGVPSGWRARADQAQRNVASGVAQDAGLSAQAARSSAWGSNDSGDWASQTGPAPSWVTDDAPAAQSSEPVNAAANASTDPSSNEAHAPVSATERESVREDTAALAEASFDSDSGLSEPTPEWMEDEPETDVEAVYDPLPPKEPEQPAPAEPEADDRHLTPRQRAEKAAREAAQRQEDSRRAGNGDNFVSPDDEDIENSDAVGLPVIKAVLGGTVIKEEGPEGS